MIKNYAEAAPPGAADAEGVKNCTEKRGKKRKKEKRKEQRKERKENKEIRKKVKKKTTFAIIESLQVNFILQMFN